MLLAAVLESGDFTRLYRGLSLLVSAASDGGRAYGLAGFGALEPLLREDLEHAAEAHGPTFARSLAELRAAARELPECRIWACAAAADLVGVERADIDAHLDGVMSTPRFLREIGDARLVVV